MKAASIDAAPLRPRGSSRQPKARKSDAAIARPTPTGVKSNMPNGSPTISSRTRDTMMLGEVPTSVTMPPSSEPNAIGIRSADGELFVPARELERDRHQHRERADVLHEGREHRDGADQHDDLDGVCVRYGAIGRMTRSITPERATAALTSSAQATMMTMSSEKPENALSCGTMPDEHRRRAAQQRDEVVAQPAPHEQRHHGGDDAEGERLVGGSWT